MQPPKPAPVIREATTPGVAQASSASASSSGELTSNRSRSEAWLAAKSRPTAARSPASRAASTAMTRPFVDDVLGAAVGDRIHEVPVAGQHRTINIAEGMDRRLVHGDGGHRSLAVRAPGVVLGCAERSRHARVRDHQDDVGGQGDRAILE